jgi:hypothetical protein
MERTPEKIVAQPTAEHLLISKLSDHLLSKQDSCHSRAPFLEKHHSGRLQEAYQGRG